MSDPNTPRVQITGPEIVVTGPSGAIVRMAWESGLATDGNTGGGVGPGTLGTKPSKQLSDAKRAVKSMRDGLMVILQSPPACLDAESLSAVAEMRDKLEAWDALEDFLGASGILLLLTPGKGLPWKTYISGMMKSVIVAPGVVKAPLRTIAGLQWTRTASANDTCQSKYWRAWHDILTPQPSLGIK